MPRCTRYILNHIYLVSEYQTLYGVSLTINRIYVQHNYYLSLCANTRQLACHVNIVIYTETCSKISIVFGLYDVNIADTQRRCTLLKDEFDEMRMKGKSQIESHITYRIVDASRTRDLLAPPCSQFTHVADRSVERPAKRDGSFQVRVTRIIPRLKFEPREFVERGR